MRHLLLSFLSLTALPSTSPFLPSHPTSTLRARDTTGAFRFYAADDSGKKQRRIRINVDQNVSMQRSAKGEDDDAGNDVVSELSEQPQDSTDAGETMNQQVQQPQASESDDDDSEPVDLPPERRSKRDILRRTFGLGPNKPFTNESDALDKLLASELASRIEQLDNSELVEDQSQQMTNFLTEEDEANLNATYTAIREAGMKKMMEKFETGELANVTLEEAMQVVEYSVKMEIQQQREKLNEQRSLEALREYSKKVWEEQQQRIENITSGGIDNVLEKDPITREIIGSEQDYQQYKRDIEEKINEVNAFKQELSAKEEELVVNITKRILEDNPDPNLTYNMVIAEVVAGVQKSRSEKLSSLTFGVLGNTIELEQARQDSRDALEAEKLEQEAREEALAKGYCDQEGLDAFFRKPTDPTEISMFQQIVRSIVLNRPPSVDDVVAEPKALAEEVDSTEDSVDDSDQDEDAIEVTKDVISLDPHYENEQIKKKWTLAPSEKVEAFKLLKEWREVNNERNRAYKDQERPSNKIKPLFLSYEESDENKQWEKKELEKALRRQLKTDDDVERASNDLLIKEVMEGGYTKERSLRLMNKLIDKADDRNIKEALLDVKKILLATNETKKEVVAKAPKRELFVDMKQVLRRDVDDDDDKLQPRLSPPKPITSRDTSEALQSPAIENKEQIFSTTPAIEYDDEDYAVEPPKTDFFAGTEYTPDPNRTTTTSKLLGSYEDQLFKKFAAQTGVTDEEAKAELKRNLDEINALRAKFIEEASDENIAAETVSKVGTDVSKLRPDDEDSLAQIAEQLLSKRAAVSKTTPGRDDSGTMRHELIESSGDLKELSEEGTVDIVGAQYRALLGPDGMDDEDEYRKFLKEEEEMRMKAENETLEVPDSIDIGSYAEDALSKLSARPQPTKVEDFVDTSDVMDAEKDYLEIMYDEPEDFDPFPVAESSRPSWLEKESEAKGLRRREKNKDGVDLERLREIEEQQRMADEYLERMNNGIIDIADVLDRPYFGSMDEPSYKQKYVDTSSFAERKDELMGYTTLIKEDIINFVAWKEDPAIRGMNKELRQIQKPFSEYGALLRLEGVCVDLTGMQARAWSKVAERFGYPPLEQELVKRAALYKPANAIRAVFGWTDDVIEVEEICREYHSEFNDAFNSWLEHDRSFVYPNESTRRNNSGHRKASDRTIKRDKKSRPSNNEIHETYILAWEKLALKMNKEPPTADQVIQGILIRDWEVAVPDFFGWTDFNAEQIYDIVAEYDTIIKADMKALRQKYESDTDDSDSKVAPMPERPRPSKEEIHSAYAIAWNKLAFEIGMKSPTKEEVMQGVQLRDWEACVKDVFGWDEFSDEQVRDIVIRYDTLLKDDLKVLYANYGIDHGNKFANHPSLVLKRGVIEFLEKLDSVEMPYAIMSHLGSSQLEAVLDVTGLAAYFPPEMRVSLSEHYSDEPSELLGGALRVEKHPEKCVVFDNTPSAAGTAHEVLMKCVSFVDPYPKYELSAADWTIGQLVDMELNQIRNLFSERDDNIPLAVAEAQGILKRRPAITRTSFDQN